MANDPGTLVCRVVEFVAVSDLRRLIVVVGIPLACVALVWEGNSLGIAALLLAAVVAVVLYTRPTTHQTIAASAYATGLLLICLFVLALYWNWAQASTEPLGATATRYRWRALTGPVLIGVGLWLRRIEC